MSEEEGAAAFLAVIAGFMAIGCLIGLAIQAFVCWLLSGWLKKIPAEHRKQEPGMVWLLMIPVFQLFWIFMVYPRMAQSFDSYFASKNETAESTQKMAMLYCWLTVGAIVGSFIPLVNILAGLAGLVSFVLLIIVLVKFSGLAKRIPAPAAA